MKLATLCLAAALLVTQAHAFEPERPRRGMALAIPPVYVDPLKFREGLERFHHYKVDQFISANGFGISRLVSLQDMVQPELITLQRSEPAAFTASYSDHVFKKMLAKKMEASAAPSRVAAADVKKEPEEVRALSASETRGLAELAEGKTLSISRDGGNVTVVGPLHASTGCLKCHDVKEGAMMGAFSYTLSEDVAKALAVKFTKVSAAVEPQIKPARTVKF